MARTDTLPLLRYSILISISYELPNSNRFQSLIFNELMCCLLESNKETLLKQYTESNQLWQLFASMQIQVSLAECYSIGWVRARAAVYCSIVCQSFRSIYHKQETRVHDLFHVKISRPQLRSTVRESLTFQFSLHAVSCKNVYFRLSSAFFPASLSDLFASNLFGGKHSGWIEAFPFLFAVFSMCQIQDKKKKKNRCDVVCDPMQSYSIIVCLSCYYLEVSPT